MAGMNFRMSWAGVDLGQTGDKWMAAKDITSSLRNGQSKRLLLAISGNSLSSRSRRRNLPIQAL